MTIFLDESIAIADRIAAAAFVHRDAANWVARRPALAATSRPAERPSVRSLSFDLYGGTGGIALFLARLGTYSGERSHRDLARAAMIHAVRHAKASIDAAPARRFGFYVGPMGVAWAAWEAALLLEEPDLRRQAERIVVRLAPTVGRAHDRDLMSGSAGAVLALLAMEEAGCARASATAIRLGDALVASARKRDGEWSWSPPPSQGRTREHLLGLSHGAAGIALALASLHAATGEERYRDAALGALRYERRRFDARTRNWPDLGGLAPVASPARVAWCHGAAGAGLARVAIAPLLGDGPALREAEVALATTVDHIRDTVGSPGLEVTLCHGLIGTVECASIMDEALGGRHAADLAAVSALAIERHGAAARERWGAATGYPTSVPAGCLEPSLFQGEAGIGHHLLRLHDRARVPSVLLPGPMLLAERHGSATRSVKNTPTLSAAWPVTR